MGDGLTLDSIRDVRVYQRKNGYRFSLDAVLLFSFITLARVGRVADLGAGCGVVGLMIARKYPTARVTLVELQEGLVSLCRKNIALNGLDDRVEVLGLDIGGIPESSAPIHHAFDLAVSNPPFRRPKSGLLSVDRERALARHELAIDLRMLVHAASALLAPRGRFVLIHLPERLADLMCELRSSGLEPKRMRLVHGRHGAEARMALVEAVRGGRPGMKVLPPLYVYSHGQHYTDEVRALCGAGDPPAPVCRDGLGVVK